MQHNICHRDLKLENILLDESKTAKVIKDHYPIFCEGVDPDLGFSHYFVILNRLPISDYRMSLTIVVC